MTTGAVAAPAAAGEQRPRRRQLSDRVRAERKLAYMLVGPAVIVMLLVIAYPFINTIVLSLQRADLRFPTENKWVGLDNYWAVLTSHLWWMDIIHTLIITLVTVTVEFVLGMLLALAMHRVAFARSVLRTIGLIPYAIVTVVAAYAWQYSWSLNDGGWIPHLLGLSGDPLSHQFGSYVAICMTDIWRNTPFVALLLLAGLSLVPDELLEAARVDGATAWQRFTRITLPLMKPAILVALLFRTLDAFRIFDVIYIFAQGANNTESVSMLNYSTLLNRLNLGLGSAVSVLVFVCVMIIAALFIKGFGAGAGPAGDSG